MIDDDHLNFLHIDLYFAITPRERWIGLRNFRNPNEVQEEWRNRKGQKQMYQLNLLPCIGIFFDVIRWTIIDKKKKKHHWWNKK